MCVCVCVSVSFHLKRHNKKTFMSNIVDMETEFTNGNATEIDNANLKKSAHSSVSKQEYPKDDGHTSEIYRKPLTANDRIKNINGIYSKEIVHINSSMKVNC